MRNTSKIVASSAVASVLALLVSASAFADSRHQERTGQDRGSRATTPSDRGFNRQQTRTGGNQPSGRVYGQQPSYRGGQQANPGYSQADRSRPQQWDRSNWSNRGFQQTVPAYRQESSRPQQWSRGNDQFRGNGQNRSFSQQNWNRNDRFNSGSGDRGSWRNGSFDSNRGRVWRENDRVRTQGRIRSFTRERGGFRIFLDGDRYSYWVPEARFRFGFPRIGLSIGFGGIYSGGFINVDDCFLPGDGYYSDGSYGNGYYGSAAAAGYLSGVVDRVDYRYGTATLTEDTSGRIVTVDMRNAGLENVRPGEHVELSGSWARPGLFAALRVDNVQAY